MSARFALALPFGAQLLDQGQTRFRLWAPAAQRVDVLIDEHIEQPLTRSADGFFTGVATCSAGARYRYRIDGGDAFADPAARAQNGDVHDASIVVDPCAYVWQHPRWRGRPWHEMVVYELHVGCCGGFAGVAERLPALAALGIGAIELMPIADFPGLRNWGYDGVLPFAPDSAYGTPGDLKRLIDTAHGLGLCVYLDVVYNHFGPDGNYLERYAPAFFSADSASPWGKSIDYSQPVVRDFFTYNALYWLLEYRFDGLRFDAVHAIGDHTWLDQMAAQVRRAVEPGRHVHLVLENEHNRAEHLAGAFDAQWNDDAHNVLHVLLTGERDRYYANYAQNSAERLARCLAEGFIYQGEFAPALGRARGTPSAHLAPSAFVLFLQNHDQIGNRAHGERLTTLADPAALRAAILLQLLCPQIPLLFMGEEWGARTPFLFFTDFHCELADAVRAGRRTEFANVAAFQGEVPDPNAPATFTASTPDFSEAQRGEHAAQLAYYRELLQVRRERLTPHLYTVSSLGASAVGAAAVAAAWRLADGSVLRIAINLGSEDCRAPAQRGSVLAESAPGVAACALDGRLPARSACALLTATGVDHDSA